MSQESNPFLQADGTRPNCVQMLQIILDGQASPEQKEYFRMHMELCKPCFKTFEVDMAIKEMLKTKCCGDRVTKDLVDQLKSTIQQKITS